MIVDRSFPAEYDIEVLREQGPARHRRLFYPGATEAGGKDGLSVRVAPLVGEPWIGTFAFGRYGARTLSGVFTMPDPNRLCVVSRGEAYLVNANCPSHYEIARIRPVIDARVSLKHKLFIMVDHGGLLAIGPSGVAWQTEQSDWDELRLTGKDEDHLCGTVWDLPTGSEERFCVRLADGSLVKEARSGGRRSAPIVT